MSHRWVCVLLLGALAAGIASPQSFPTDLQKYLNLSDAQVKSISDLNQQFSSYSSQQQSQYYGLQGQASAEMAKSSPDPMVVGNAYAQMEMLRRGYNDQLAQLQSKVGAVLTADQAVLVNGLLSVERLQTLVSEAQCVYLEGRSAFSNAGFADFLLGVPSTFTSTNSTVCQIPPMPTALSNYLSLSDGQIAAIENAILGNQDYLSRQALKTAELQNDIKDLTAAPTIDSAKLGADYIAMAQIQSDESVQGNQLITTVRGVLTAAQQPQLQSLDNAIKLSFTASEAVGLNILVLPPDLQNSSNCGPFLLPYPGILLPVPFGGITSYPGTVCERSGDFSALLTSAARLAARW